MAEAAKQQWSPPKPTRDGGIWRVDAARLKDVPGGPDGIVRQSWVQIEYKTGPLRDRYSVMVLYYFHCDRRDVKIASQTTFGADGSQTLNIISSLKSYHPIPANSDMADIADAACNRTAMTSGTKP